MSYRHGVYLSEVPTSVIPPARTSAGLPVVFGTAPVNLVDEAPVNKPILCYTYGEAVQAFGYSDDWEKYTLCEFMKSHFALFVVAPVVFVNVLDPAEHKIVVAPASVAMASGVALVQVKGVVLSSITVKLTSEGPTVAKEANYTAEFNSDGYVVITRIATGTIPADQAQIFVGYTKLDPSVVNANDIIGGIDVSTGAYTGLELLNKIFPMFRLLPGLVLAPGWSHDPAVAAIMTAKAGNINSHFKCLALTDVPTDEVELYTDVAAWKNDNNYTSSRQVVCWPKVKLGEEQFHLSTQAAGVICRTDSENEDIPYVSPSNKNLQANGAVLADGTEVALGPDQTAYLNGQGIVTALNFIGGWKLWGNRTGVYPGVTDPKDAFIPIRRMFDWVANTLVLTFWQKVDYPLNRRLIDTVLDSANIWLNGLAARQFILGGRVEFQQDENPATDILDGIVRFHVYLSPPPPAREIDFVLEYDPQYLQTLFG